MRRDPPSRPVPLAGSLSVAPDLGASAGADLLVSEGLSTARRLAARRDHAGLLRLSRICPAARRDVGVMMAAARGGDGATVAWGWPSLSSADRRSVVAAAAVANRIGLALRLAGRQASLLQTAFVAGAGGDHLLLLKRLARLVPDTAWAAAAHGANISSVSWLNAHSPVPLAAACIREAWDAREDARLDVWLRADPAAGAAWLLESQRFSDEAEWQRIDRWLAARPDLARGLTDGVTTEHFPQTAATVAAVERTRPTPVAPPSSSSITAPVSVRA